MTDRRWGMTEMPNHRKKLPKNMALIRIDHLTEKDFARLREYEQVRQPSTDTT
jgi:hypothetical protein